MKPSRLSKYSRGWGKTDCRWWAERSYKRRRPPQQGERMTVGHNLIQLSPYRSGKAWLWKCWRVECTIASSMSFCASNLHGPLKAGLFADLIRSKLSGCHNLIRFGDYKHHLQTVDTVDTQFYAIFTYFHHPWWYLEVATHGSKCGAQLPGPSFHQGGHAIIVYTGGEDLQSAAKARSGCVGTLSDVTWRLPSGKLT